MSSTAQYIGFPIAPAVIQETRDPVKGYSEIAEYEGTLIETDLIIASLAKGIRSDRRPVGNGMYQLTLYSPDKTDGSAAEQQDTWELLGNRVEKDIYEHPKSVALTAAEIKAIRTYIKNLPKDHVLPSVFLGGDPTDPANYTDVTGDALALFNLIHKGTTKFLSTEYVLRYTVTVSTRSQVQASFSHVEELFTPSGLATPSASGVRIPPDIGFSLNQITYDTAPTGFEWSWYKMSPTVRAQGGKVVISQEWWWDLWSTWLYGTPVA